MLKKATLLTAIAAATALGWAATAHAGFPEKTIRMVIPWKAGGGTDSIGRGLQPAFGKASGQKLIIDNISGAGTVSGTIAVLKSKPDGYTILMNGSTDVVAPLTFKPDLPYTLDNFKFVGGFFFSPTWVVSHRDRGYSDLKDLLDDAKANPGKIKLGIAGSAGAQMLMGASIKGITGYDITLVPFSGGADLKKAVLGNHVHAGVIHAPVMLGAVKSGLIRVLGAGGSLEAITYPPVRDKPTLRDLNIPVDIGVTRGVFVPKETPDAIVAKLEKILETAAKSDHFKAFGRKFGFAPTWIPSKDFKKQVYGELKAFREIKAKYLK